MLAVDVGAVAPASRPRQAWRKSRVSLNRPLDRDTPGGSDWQAATAFRSALLVPFARLTPAPATKASGPVF